MKLEVPRFDGQDPLDWIFKIQQFFDYQGISDAERLTVASFYMEGPALCWYQWMSRNGFLTSWQAMLQALESRFAPSYYDDPYRALFKLQQRSSVNEYLSEFERLANRVIGLAPPLLMSCFISGLSPDLRREVQAFQPVCLTQAMALAKLQEDKLSELCRRSPRCPPHGHHPTPAPISSRPPMSPPTTTHSPLSQPPSTPTLSKPPIHRLSSEELALKRDKGICYYYGHRCHPRIHLLIAEDDIPPPTTPPLPDSPLPSDLSSIPPTEDSPPHLSLNALANMPTPETFRVYGTVCGHRFTILIDGGSTHNFVQLRVAKFLGLPSTTISPLTVMVGDGGIIQCTRRYPSVPITI